MLCESIPDVWLLASTQDATATLHIITAQQQSLSYSWVLTQTFTWCRYLNSNLLITLQSGFLRVLGICRGCKFFHLLWQSRINHLPQLNIFQGDWGKLALVSAIRSFHRPQLSGYHVSFSSLFFCLAVLVCLQLVYHVATVYSCCSCLFILQLFIRVAVISSCCSCFFCVLHTQGPWFDNLFFSILSIPNEEQSYADNQKTFFWLHAA